MIRIALLLLLLPVPPVAGQAPYARLRGETEAAQTRKRLVEAQAKLADGKTADAVDDLLRVLADSGDDLIPLPDGSHPPARRLVHRVLAGLPADALKNLRDRIDAPARKLFDAGRAARDPKPLRELLDRYCVSRAAEPALLLLGELAFERGHFAAAERYWRTLLPATTDGALSFPQPTTAPATATAKALLAALFAGDTERVAKELTDFRKKYPDAAGRLAGLDGNYADTLAKLLAAPPQVPPRFAGWSTLGGNSARDGRPSQPLPRVIPNRPKWKTPIPRDAADRDHPKPANVSPSRPLAHHPVVLGGSAYLADAGRVFAFDLRTGAARVAYDARALADMPALEPGELAKPILLNADFALTVADGKLYARLGNLVSPGAPRRDNEAKRTPASFLLRLEPTNAPNPPPGALTLNQTWLVSPPGAPGTPAAWGGAPVVVDGIALAAFTRLENSRRVRAVAAYRPPSTKPLWVADACDEDANQAEEFPHRHELLTLAGANVVYATHTGLTVAFDVSTGKRRWAFRNPPAARPPVGGSPRDICPAVAHGGRVFLAPADGDRVYALDAETGAKLWQSAGAEGIQIDHLLGVTRNKLIAAVHGPQKGLRAFAVTDGTDREPTGWRNHDDPHLGNYGRGLVSDAAILWPTAAALYSMNPDDGSVLRDPRPGPHGNLAFADGVLLVATPTELWGYLLGGTPPGLPPAPVARPWVKLEPTPFRAVEKTVARRTDFDPLAAPALPVEAGMKAIPLPPGAWPIRPFADGPELPGLNSRAAPADQRFFACDGRALFAVRLSNGSAIWKTPLDPATAFTRGMLTTDGKLLALSRDAVGCFDANFGRALWRFTLPDFPVTAVALAGSRVVVLLGEYALVALDFDTGKPAWQLDAQLRPRLTARAVGDAPAFAPHLFGTPRAVFAHRTDGSRIAIDPDTGTATATAHPATASWSGPPVSDGSTVIHPDGPLRVVARGGTAWTREFPGETSGTGRAPAVRVLGGAVLVAVSRNYGVEFQRLDSGSGKPLWANAPVLHADDVDLSALDGDDERLYVPAGNRVTAFNTRTGREAWSRELPGDGWRVRVGRAGVIAYAPSALPTESLEEVAARLAWRFIEHPGRLVGLMATLVSAAWNRTLPVLLLDAETGAVRKRWDVPTAGPVVGVHFAGDVALVASVGVVMELRK